jgi:sterol desaturase/sphingolipid hydroxylase (fatty acid hydroxylase superfamily)
LLSVMLPFLIANTSFATGLVWFAVENICVLSEHSGYHFPFLPTPVMHDYHHMKFNECELNFKIKCFKSIFCFFFRFWPFRIV